METNALGYITCGADAGGAASGGSLGQFQYNDGASGFAGTANLFINTSGAYTGFIGIGGTTTPSSHLSVAGNTYLDSNILNISSSTASTLTVNYLSAATSTIINNSQYAWTIATSTTATPIFSINTTGSGKATTTIIGGFNLDNGAFNYETGSGIASVDSLNTGPMAFDTDAGVISWIDLPSSTTTAGLYNSYSAQIGTTPVLTIFGTTTSSGAITHGTVGIGTSTPQWTLTVVGGICISTGSKCPAAEVNGGLRVDTAGTSAGDDPGDVFDVAERYPSMDAVEAGDIMAIDKSASSTKASIKKAVIGDVALGIVSSRPALAMNGSEVILGAGSEGTTTRPLVALAGRVPVKISLDGGPIQKGDRITLSSIPGIGAKATTSGVTVGIALEAFDASSTPGVGEILVAVNLGYSKLDSGLLDGGWLIDMKSGKIKTSYILDMDNKDIINARNILSASGAWSIDENGKLIVQEIETGKLKVGSQEKPTGITLYDTVTGAPYCIKVTNGAMVSAAGACVSSIDSSLPIPPGPSPAAESSILDLPATSTDAGQIGTTPTATPLDIPTPTPTSPIPPEPSPTPTDVPTPTPTSTLIPTPSNTPTP